MHASLTKINNIRKKKEMTNSSIFFLIGILACATLPSLVLGQSVAEIVTPSFFDGIKNQAPSTCPGNGFYSRDVFLEAVNSYSNFGVGNNPDDSKREIAAFFAHFTHETGFFCNIEQTDRSGDYCDETYTQYPCTAGKSYYGRGPLQLSFNYNYALAGANIGFDGLNDPEKVATDSLVSFKSSLWFWMTNVHEGFISGQGFGGTIRVINSRECGGQQETASNRIQYYSNYCSQFGVSPGENLRC